MNTHTIMMTEPLNYGIGVIQKFHPCGDRLVQCQLRRCCRYAKKYGWSDFYLSLAAEWCVGCTLKAIRKASLDGEVIRCPRHFLAHHLSTALKRDRRGAVVIPVWKQELRMSGKTLVNYSDNQKGL